MSSWSYIHKLPISLMCSTGKTCVFDPDKALYVSAEVVHVKTSGPSTIASNHDLGRIHRFVSFASDIRLWMDPSFSPSIILIGFSMVYQQAHVQIFLCEVSKLYR